MKMTWKGVFVTRNYYWTGEIVTKSGITYTFTNADIVKGSGYITKQCCGNSEIEIGTVYAAELGITLRSNIDRYTLEGGTITLSFHLEVGESYEEVSMGIFEISEANRTVKCLEIKAYDYMLRFEKTFPNQVSNGTAYDFLSLACQECEVELAHTQDEIDDLLNGKYILSIYQENDIETWRDLIYYVAQILGCCALINREGKLQLMKYGNTSVMDIPSKQRYQSSFSDFITRYSAISFTNVKTQESEYYALEPDDALTMNLGVNPLLQLIAVETRQVMLFNILNDIAVIHYVPFDSTTIGNPAFDLGDVITFSGGQADEEQITTITSITYKINGKHSLKCVGKNPRLSLAKSKNEKNIAGLLNSVEAGKMILYSYTNARRYEVGEGKAEIVNIEFTTLEETDAQFLATVILDICDVPESALCQLEVIYFYNGNENTFFVPKELYCDGSHVLNLYYPLTGIKAKSYHTFQVFIKASNGTVQIKPGQIKATIFGQGLAAGEVEWDGRLQIEEIFEEMTIAGIRITPFTETVTAVPQIPIAGSITETFAPISLNGITMAGFTDSVSAVLEDYELSTEALQLLSELTYSKDYSYYVYYKEGDNAYLLLSNQLMNIMTNYCDDVTNMRVNFPCMYRPTTYPNYRIYTYSNGAWDSGVDMTTSQTVSPAGAGANAAGWLSSLDWIYENAKFVNYNNNTQGVISEVSNYPSVVDDIGVLD